MPYVWLLLLPFGCIPAGPRRGFARRLIRTRVARRASRRAQGALFLVSTETREPKLARSRLYSSSAV
jgi:hypothetical protein